MAGISSSGPPNGLRSHLKSHLKSHWGLLIFAFSTAAALIQLWNTRHWSHYRIFSGAARLLWSGQDPHFNDFGTNLGYWYYSPSCGLFYYGLFSWMPDRLGIYVYMLSSIFVFIAGALYFTNSVLPRERTQITDQWLNLFWFWISFELMAGILATKTEITMAGVLLFVAGAVIRDRGRFWAPLLLAMIVNWKFQPLPFVGLLSILLLIVLKRPWFLPVFLLSILFWFAVPGLVLNPDTLATIMGRWSSSLNDTIASEWRDFMHVYRFLEQVFGIPIQYKHILPTAAFAGSLMAGLTALWALQARRKRGRAFALHWGVPLALSLGSAFMVSFSPYGQTNAFILYTPVLLTAVIALHLETRARSSIHSPWQRYWFTAILVGGTITSVLNSDIVTKTGRLFFVSIGLKPIGSLILCSALCWYLFKRVLVAERDLFPVEQS